MIRSCKEHQRNQDKQGQNKHFPGQDISLIKRHEKQKMHACIYINCIDVHVYLLVYTYVLIYIHMYVLVCIYTFTHTSYVYIYTLMYRYTPFLTLAEEPSGKECPKVEADLLTEVQGAARMPHLHSTCKFRVTVLFIGSSIYAHIQSFLHIRVDIHTFIYTWTIHTYVYI